MSILELNNVCYKYAGAVNQVLTGVNIELEKGSLYCIMGKSGAGKTTILSLVSGLDLPTAGEIYYEGKDMKSIDRDKYRAVNSGIIFQGCNLLTNATALENIVLSMNISNIKIKNKKQYAYELLEKLEIDKQTADRKVLKLSGGEQQRICIARVLSHNPDIVIADEPTGNLDDDARGYIMEILSNLAHNDNKCVIVVTHSKAVADYADELWGLNAGKLSFIK